MLSEEERRRAVAESEMRERETERILPELVGMMWGNGGFRLDTDTLDLTDPGDYHHLHWLARLTSSFVLKEREFWRKPTDDLRHKIEKQEERIRRLENILDQLRELTDNEDTPFDAEKAQAIIKQYRNPLEEHYDKMRADRERSSVMKQWEDELIAQQKKNDEEEQNKLLGLNSRSHDEQEDTSKEVQAEETSDEEE